VPIVRTASLASHPGLAEALGFLAGRIGAPTMRRLNQAVDGEHREPREVAKGFLRSLASGKPASSRP
jgi:osmoprotectant transport system substrate-binding protein